MQVDHKASEDLAKRSGWTEDSLGYAREHGQRKLAWLLKAVKDDVEFEGALVAMPPGEHPAFFSASRLTLNVTRAAMAAMGWCPSGRLFEASACGTALISDAWAGLDAFFRPGEEILIARDRADVLAALDRSEAEIHRIAEAGRARTLADHTAERRLDDFERALAERDCPEPAEYT